MVFRSETMRQFGGRGLVPSQQTLATRVSIGYGDIVPRQALGRALAVGIGICGLFLTGLTAGIAVYAMRTALAERENG